MIALLKEQSEVRVDIPNFLSLQQLAEMLNKDVLQDQIKVDQNLGHFSLITSKTKWTVSELLAVVQTITHSDIRQVGPIVYITPSKTKREIFTPSKELIKAIGSLESNWQRSAPLLRLLQESPLSDKNKLVPQDVLFNPQLIPYDQLTNEQKELVRTDSWNSPPSDQLIGSTDSHSIECYFPVVIQLKLSNSTNTLSTEFTLPIRYNWLVLRTISIREG